MNTEKYEKEMQEQRLIEATKKGLTGRDGKLSVILKVLGEPIIYHSMHGGFVDSNYLDDPYAPNESIETARNHEEIRDRMPMELGSDPNDPKSPIGIPGGTDERDPSSQEWRANPDIGQIGEEVVGWNFDGLNQGMHLEIRYMSSALTCHYKGYEVYKELRGELVGYAPIDEWEEWIDKLYKVARKKLGKKEIIQSVENEKEAERKKASWWASFRLRWGL